MSHQCPRIDCDEQVPDSRLACRTHWFWVSRATRARVWNAYSGPGVGSDEHTEAITQAITEINQR